MGESAFKSLLTETVKAPRLSGTKVTSLTEMFLASLDTSYITTFFKLNRSLPHGGQARISSLYVFDALSRAAHRESVKGKRKADGKRCLDGLEAVSENWVDGMMISDGGAAWPEGKEKARKVIEIWRKSETFPSDTTERLIQKLNSTQPVASGSGSTTPPYEPGQPPPISPALPPLDPKGLTPVSGLNGEGSSIKSPPQASSTTLPADILKLLGASASTAAGTSASPTNLSAIGNNPGSAELAAILANLPKTQSPNPNSNTSTASATASTNGNVNGNANANPLAGLNFGQLAELAKVAQKIQSPINLNVQSPHQHHQHSQPPSQLPGFPGTLPPPQSLGQGFIPPTAQQAYGQFNLGLPGQGTPPNQHQPQPQQQRYPHAQDRGEEQMPPGTSRNYGRVKPLKNPQTGMRGDDEDRSPLVSMDNGYQRSGPAQGPGGPGGSGGIGGMGMNQNRRESGDRPPPGGRGWDRERSRSPDRRMRETSDRDRDRERDRDGGWGNRGRSRGGYSNQGSRDATSSSNGGDEFGRDQNRDTRPPIPTRPSPQSQSHAAQSPTVSSFAGAGSMGGPTLETFDMSSFNPMDPNSWSSLGEAWKRSRGSEPNQMELMGWMQEKMMGGGQGQQGQQGQAGFGPGPSMGMGMGMGMGVGMGMQPGQGGGWGGQQGEGGGGGGWGGQQGGW